MKYLLVWAFAINSNCICGTATFNEKSQCLEAKELIKSYRPVPKNAYIECTLIDSDSKAPMFSMLHVKHEMESKLTKE